MHKLRDIKTIIWEFKANTRTNLVSARFLWALQSSRAPFSASLIFTRRRPVSSQGHGLIDFYFHSIFPRSLLSCHPRGTKTSKRVEKKKPQDSALRGEAQKVRGEEAKRSSSLRLPKGQNNKCRLNWGSPRTQRGQNVTFWQRRPSWRDKLI